MSPCGAQGFTALHWAAANGHADTVAALVKLGLAADTHVPRRSFTPLQVRASVCV